MSTHHNDVSTFVSLVLVYWSLFDNVILLRLCLVNKMNRYIIKIVNEYSRFPFTTPCSNTCAFTVIECLRYFLFGLIAYIYLDQGPSFM